MMRSDFVNVFLNIEYSESSNIESSNKCSSADVSATLFLAMPPADPTTVPHHPLPPSQTIPPSSIMDSSKGSTPDFMQAV